MITRTFGVVGFVLLAFVRFVMPVAGQSPVATDGAAFTLEQRATFLRTAAIQSEELNRSGTTGSYIITLSDGRIIGVFDTGNSVKSSPIVIDDTILIHTRNGELQRFNTANFVQLNCVEPRGDGKQCGR